MIMGYIAKLDGRVSEKEIQVARQAMHHLQLTPEQKLTAIEYFNLGKANQFNLETALDNFVQHCGHHPQLVQLFVEIQVQCALVDGMGTPVKRRVLERLCDKLQIPYHILAQMEKQHRSYQYTPPPQEPQYSHQDELTRAYELLGVTPAANFKQIKKAYRQMMSQHHPDKLVAKGLPKEMIQVATEKTQRIQKAYEIISQSRGEK
jgi:DnaJ like chaperone protein